MELQNYEREHLETLRKSLAECTVLLKSNGQFPLEKAGEIALYGSGARNTVKGGTGSGEVNSRFFVNIEQGLEKAGFTITTKEWLDAYDQVRAEAQVQFTKEIKARARKNHTLAILEGMGAVMPEPDYELPLNGAGDTAVYVLSRISGEGSDRKPVKGDILLGDTECRDILALREKYEKFILVLNVGGPVDLSPVSEVENILLLSQLGVETGDALADILLGKSSPSGKLTTTWTAWEDYAAVGDFGHRDDTYYKEGIYVGYRYFDSVEKKSLFPFGHGLSYTEFEIYACNVFLEKDQVIVKALIKNTGARAGKEVVQVYVSCPKGKLDKPVKQLAAWTKTRELDAGEEQKLVISFGISDLASYDTQRAEYVLEQGDYVIRIGNSSVGTAVGAIVRLDKDAVVRKVKNCLGTPGFEDWKPEILNCDEDLEDVKILELSAEAIKTEEITYKREYDIAPEVKALTDEQLVHLNIGEFDPKGGITSVIGNASKTVAGAAGETTGRLKEEGFPVLVTADGPAGLRLSKRYVVEADGVRAIGETMPISVSSLLPKPVLWLMSRSSKKKQTEEKEIHYQYTTAIPIGTALAQSWNLDFARECGDIVGAEMERFGVHLWLAPALNIHRSIQCGRNFEYFSEDPLIGGLFAAALTGGVQKHPGCGTTLKHYAANNQETNRYNSNSNVSERAMREIYLRGFEICIKNVQPHALMTSYNLVNGVHTSESKDLIENILRCEYGYEGIVMTDWLVAGLTFNNKFLHRGAVASEIAAAGGDLVMPGSKKDFKGILDALKQGKLDKKQLQINATRVYRMAKRLTEVK